MIDFILHSDKHLLDLVGRYGTWVYGILFAIIFSETGFIVTPFLPGDSLLFATGALCAAGVLSTPVAAGLVGIAAFAGNAVNYAAGRAIGPRIFELVGQSGNGQPGGGQGGGPGRLLRRLVDKEHLARAQAFFDEYGGKAVVLSRFVPIVRTFLPFVAGAAQMRSHEFGLYNLVGAAGWVALCVGGGFVFGNVPIVKQNFSLVTIGIVIVSLLPIAIGHLRHRNRATEWNREGQGLRQGSGQGEQT